MLRRRAFSHQKGWFEKKIDVESLRNFQSEHVASGGGNHVECSVGVARMRIVSISGFLFAVLSLCSACGFLPEATFTLSPESRLPFWLTTSAKFKRSDVSVSISYYIDASGRTIRFTAWGPDGAEIVSGKGDLSGLEPTKIYATDQGEETGERWYEVATVNGVSDVLEHRRREPIVYMSSDPKVWTRLGLSHDILDVNGFGTSSSVNKQ